MQTKLQNAGGCFGIKSSGPDGSGSWGSGETVTVRRMEQKIRRMEQSRVSVPDKKESTESDEISPVGRFGRTSSNAPDGEEGAESDRLADLTLFRRILHPKVKAGK